MQNASLHQTQSLQQTLSPQMRQSLQFLQAPSLELEQLLQQNLLNNPVLDAEMQHETLEPENWDEEWVEQSWSEDDQRDREIALYRQQSNEDDAQAKRDFFFSSIVGHVSLTEHLNEQLKWRSLTPHLQQAAETLLGYLDDRGYLSQPLEEIALESNQPFGALEQALTVIQHLEPAGIGAQNLPECLLLQLRALGQFQSLEATLIRDYLDDLLRKNYSKLTKELQISEEQLNQALEHLAKLDPSPGSIFQATHNPHILPDLIVEKDELGEWNIRTQDEFLPKLSINSNYKDLATNPRTPSDARAHIRDYLRDARFIMRALEQRQETLLLIGREIVKRQQAVLLGGLSELTPMTMNEVAESLEIHATTVSRAVSSKYLLCPAGLLELRAFFTSGYETSSGSTISNEFVKSRIHKIIQLEDPKKPISDSQLVYKLESEGLAVARRTVAKYREQLGILPTHQRKQR